MREKGWEEKGPKAHSKNSDFGTPMIEVRYPSHGKRKSAIGVSLGA